MKAYLPTLNCDLKYQFLTLCQQPTIEIAKTYVKNILKGIREAFSPITSNSNHQQM